MAGWSRGSIAVMAIALALGVGAGFALGWGIGGRDSTSAIPSEITTRAGAMTVPTLSATREVPALEVSEDAEDLPAEAEDEGEANIQESGFEPESFATPETTPEVTVAPSG